MLFNSLPFLYIFLPLTCFVYWCLRSKQSRLAWLTLTGYIFYACWDYRFCSLMAFSTLVSYFAGLGLAHFQKGSVRKFCLIAPITIDLLLLGFFKYFNFAAVTLAQIASRLGLSINVPSLALVLPVGISFYTIHTISYIVDSYRRVVKPTKNLLEFSCYVSLFSQLVAGPIVRFKQIEHDLHNIEYLERRQLWAQAWSFIAIGLIEKVLIADTIAAVINPLLAHFSEMSTIEAWLCALGYTYQLYFDFLGYSDMAVGLGYLFGIHIPQNFNSPYKAADITDFWRRWHISLSTCLRDYLYIPLGGKEGKNWQVNRNVMLTMLIGGLWHGANWTFVLWGSFHGFLLLANRALLPQLNQVPLHLRQAGTFLLLMIGWVLFRSSDLNMALIWWQRMFTWHQGQNFAGMTTLIITLAIAFVLAHIAANSFQMTHKWNAMTASFIGILFAVCLFLIYGAQASPFLYFQF